MVELKNVSVTYSSGVDALNNVSLKINDGDFAFVVGSSGAGKSTMIKLLLKEIDATSGVVTVNGYNLNKLKKRKIPEFRRTLGFVFQDFRLIPSMTVSENIEFVLRVIDAPIKYIRKRVPYVISLVGLHAKTNSYPDELSGGEKQRVAIARALVNDPQLIIADEPTGNIDPELSYEIVELLKGINDQGTTILMVTHEHDLVRHFGGRIINITEGEIVFDEVITGTSDELLADMDTEMPADAMAQAVSDAEHINDNVREVNTEENIELPIENMTADDIISAIGGVPEQPKPEKELMKPVKENIDVDITQELPKLSSEETPEEILASLSDKTEGGAE